jgi:sporulation protein YlmC with PRC-barrel domain
MKLSTNARIFTADGKDIGNLNRFVINPRTKAVSHIVFEHGLLEKTEYLLPMYLVDHIDDAGIHFKPLPVKEVAELPRFKDEDYLITDEHALLDRGYVSDDMIRSYYYYPTVSYGTSAMLRPSDMHIFNPPEGATTATQLGVPVSGKAPVVKETDENIPNNTVALKEGAKVYSKEKKQLGNVEKVFVDSKSLAATHFLISKGLLFKEHKLIPVDWIEDLNEEDVYLTVDQAFMERVPDYKGE